MGTDPSTIRKSQALNVLVNALKGALCFKNFCLGQRLRTFVQKFLISPSVVSKTLGGLCILQRNYRGGFAPHISAVQNTQAPLEFLTQLRVRLRTFAQEFLIFDPNKSS